MSIPDSLRDYALMIGATIAVLSLGVVLISWYRREMIEDPCDPESDHDAFQEAYFDGEMTAEELAKVREALSRRETEAAGLPIQKTRQGPDPRIGSEPVGYADTLDTWPANDPGEQPSEITDPSSDATRPGPD